MEVILILSYKGRRVFKISSSCVVYYSSLLGSSSFGTTFPGRLRIKRGQLETGRYFLFIWACWRCDSRSPTHRSSGQNDRLGQMGAQNTQGTPVGFHAVTFPAPGSRGFKALPCPRPIIKVGQPCIVSLGSTLDACFRTPQSIQLWMVWQLHGRVSVLTGLTALVLSLLFATGHRIRGAGCYIDGFRTNLDHHAS